MSYSIITVILTVTAFVVLVLVVWNATGWARLRPGGPPSSSSVSILIPARNEEANIGECLAAAADQGDTVREILVYDDHSTDGTATVVRKIMEWDPRIRLLDPQPLPAGWKGKPFACSQLAQAASGEWLLFLDADTRLTSHTAGEIVRVAEQSHATLLSLWPGLRLESWVEQWLMPMLNMVVFTLYPAPLSFKRNWPCLGLAHGACMLFHRETYQRLGGHTLVKSELFEDTVLAREWRRLGERSLCWDGQDVVHVRMYSSLGQIWQGFLKNFYPAFRTSLGFWSFLVFHAGLFLSPFLASSVCVVKGVPCPWLFAWASAVLSMRLVQCLRFRYPVWSALIHPTAEAMLILVGLASWWSVRSGRGVVWKGRRYGVR